MPREKREAIKTVYAFCRKTDDIVDDQDTSNKTKKQKLKKWRIDLSKALEGKINNSLFDELIEVINQFKIPHDPFFELINGVELDLVKNRYYNFNELKDYCYKVASTVGLMTIPIFGYNNKETEKFAINLGIALQLTNIIRDVKFDAEINRIYLPQDEIHKFKYSEEELIESKYNEHFITLMMHQAERAKKYYENADKLLTENDKSSMFTAKSMEYIYVRLLDLIEQENYNVFKKKIRVSNINKIIIALGVFVKYQIFPRWLNL